MNYKKYIRDCFDESAGLKRIMGVCSPELIEKIADEIVSSYKNRGKVLVFGNGGSAADAQHFAAELVGWYKIKNRSPLEAIALTTDSSVITAVGNDAGYDMIFARQVYAHGKKGDVAVGISTSGNSPNVVAGIDAAVAQGLKTVSLTGAKASKLSGISDYVVQVPSNDTPRVQEVHITVIHILCGLVEQKLSEK